MLEAFFDLVGHHLEAGPLGPLLRDVQTLAQRHRPLDLLGLIETASSSRLRCDR